MWSMASRSCWPRARSRTGTKIQLLTQAAAMVDGVYHMIYEELKPGVRENDIVAMSNKLLYEMGIGRCGSDQRHFW